MRAESARLGTPSPQKGNIVASQLTHSLLASPSTTFLVVLGNLRNLPALGRTEAQGENEVRGKKKKCSCLLYTSRCV